MAVTTKQYTVVGGSLGPYTYPFDHIDDGDVEVSVNGAIQTVTTHYTLDSTNKRITFTSGSVSTGDSVVIYRNTTEDPITNTFVAGSTIRSNELNDNFNQLLYIAQESDNQALSTLGGTMQGTLEIGEDQVIKFEGATANANETTLTVVDPTADRTITLPNVTGTVVTTGDTGTVTTQMIEDATIVAADLASNSVTTAKITDSAVTTAKIADDSVTTAKLVADCVIGSRIADNSIDSEHYVDGSIDTAHIGNLQITTAKILNNAVTHDKLADNAVDRAAIVNDAVNEDKIADIAVRTEHIANNAITSAKIADDAVTTAKIAANAITQTELGDNSVDTLSLRSQSVSSEKILDGTIVAGDMADNAVTTAKIADAQITEAKLGGNAVTTAKIAGGAVTEAKLATNSVSTTRIVNDAVNSDKIADNAVTSAHIAAGNVTSAEIADNAVTHGKMADNSVGTAELRNGEVTNAKLGADSVNGTKIADDSINSEHYVDGSIDTAHIADNQVTTAKIPDNAVTVAKIADAELSTLAGMQSGTASILASSTALTSTTAELNMLDGKQINNSINSGASHGGLPTSLAVNNRIIELVTEVGGFVPIANETSFPSTNPDINNGAGTIVSIKALSSAIVCGSGVTTKTIANGAGSGNTVTINGLAQNTTYPAGRGMLLETTSTLHTYTYHRLTLDESGVADAQAAVDDFQARYRVASSAPTSSLDDGDLYFDTTVNKMKVYNASSSSWDDVATPGDFFITTLSSYSGTGGNSATFNGSAYRFVLSNTPNDAQQLLVSVNGVIQKPNAGTSQPSEGFAVNGSSILFSSAPASGSDYFIVTIGSSVNIGTPSDNTVATAKIQNGAVTEEKLSISNGPQNGYFLQTNGSGTLTWAEVDLTAATDYADNTKVRWGTGNDLEIFHENSYNTSRINSTTGNIEIRHTVSSADEAMAKFIPNGATELFYDGSKKFETTSIGVQATGHIFSTTKFRGNDDVKVSLGTSEDLQIFHQSSDESAVIKNVNDTGWLRILSGDSNSSGILLKNRDDDVTYLKAFNEGSVELYYNNSKKFETTANGVAVTGNIYLDDSEELRLGNSGDLQLFHNGSTGNNHIYSNVNALVIQSDDLNIENKASTASLITANNGADVSLYHNNSKKLETTSWGVQVNGSFVTTGLIDLSDGNGTSTSTIALGNDDDLKIYHDSANNYWNASNGHTYILANTNNIYLRGVNNEDGIIVHANSGVDLFFNNSKKLETTNGGVNVTGAVDCTGGGVLVDDSYSFSAGTGGDLLVYHDGTNSWINNSTGDLYLRNGITNEHIIVQAHTGGNIYLRVNAGEEGVVVTHNGDVELYYDNVKKFQTESYGAQCLGEFFIGDGSHTDGSKHLRIGNGGDMRFWHDGSNSHFANYHGAMHWQQKDSRSHYWSTNDSWRLELDASGHLKPYTNNASDLGTSSKRWRNVYTNDLNLSNEGSSNEVDGTWGNYTIQEGEDDLFLINRRNGKKYKFNLTEVN